MKKALFFAALGTFCLGSLGPSDETCCPTRDLAMMPTPMPAGQEQDLSNLFEGAVLHPLIWDAIESMDASCPEISFYDLEAKAEADDRVVKIDKAWRKQKGLPPDKDAWKPPPPEEQMDYILRGSLTANKVTGKDLSGNLEGAFTFNLKLVDHHHNDEVLKEDSRSWTGGIMDRGAFAAIESMAESFRPLPPLLKGYERIAETAKIDVPNDQVEAGETETIKLSELLDKDGRQTQWWQRLLVHIEKGKITNAEQVVDAHGKTYYIFRAKQGTVDINYQAPDDCDNVRETLTVSNCCEKKEDKAGGVFMGLHPKKEIGKKEFDIVCKNWELTINSSSETRYRYDHKREKQTIRQTDDEYISAKVYLPLVLDRWADVPNEGQRYAYFHAQSRDLSSFSGTFNSERSNRSDYGDIGAVTTRTVHKTSSDGKFDAPFLDDVVVLVFDRKSGQALKAAFPAYDISFTWNVQDTTRTEQWNPNFGTKQNNDEKSRRENAHYHAGPVKEQIDDPYAGGGGLQAYVEEQYRKRGLNPPAGIPEKEQKEHRINPEFLVTKGDGKTTFGGEGTKTEFKPTSAEGNRREEKIFRWEIKRRKK